MTANLEIISETTQTRTIFFPKKIIPSRYSLFFFLAASTIQKLHILDICYRPLACSCGGVGNL